MINTNLNRIRQSLVSKLILSAGLILLISMSTWAYFNIKYLKEKVITDIKEETDRLSNTIKLGTHYAMMLNSRDDINQIINNIGKQPEIKNIRLYNKEGEDNIFKQRFRNRFQNEYKRRSLLYMPQIGTAAGLYKP